MTNKVRDFFATQPKTYSENAGVEIGVELDTLDEIIPYEDTDVSDLRQEAVNCIEEKLNNSRHLDPNVRNLVYDIMLLHHVFEPRNGHDYVKSANELANTVYQTGVSFTNSMWGLWNKVIGQVVTANSNVEAAMSLSQSENSRFILVKSTVQDSILSRQNSYKAHCKLEQDKKWQEERLTKSTDLFPTPKKSSNTKNDAAAVMEEDYKPQGPK